MTQRQTKQFQSGREVFERYIPGYVLQTTQDPDEVDGSKSSGEPSQLARSILSQLKHDLSAVQLRNRRTRRN